MRILSAVSGRTMALFYLIVPMVGDEELIPLLFGLDYYCAVIILRVPRTVWLAYASMIATTRVQVLKATLLLGALHCRLLGILSQPQILVSLGPAVWKTALGHDPAIFLGTTRRFSRCWRVS